MVLTRNRIWGNIIGDNSPSGYKQLKKPMNLKKHVERYDQSRLDMMYPFFKDWERLNYRKEKYSDRKMRIFMRGMKIGQ